MKITVIELLNKIAKGEIPDKIKHKGIVYKYKETELGTGYVNTDDEEWYNWFSDIYAVDSKEDLNEEVEILEDEEIETIEEYKTEYTERCIDVEVREKINEIIRVVNKMQKEDKTKENIRLEMYDRWHIT